MAQKGDVPSTIRARCDRRILADVYTRLVRVGMAIRDVTTESHHVITALDKELLPYRNLFAAVVLRAITDYVNPDFVLRETRVGSTKEDAYKFLTTPQRVGPFLELLDIDIDTFCEGVRVGSAETIRQRLRKTKSLR